MVHRLYVDNANAYAILSAAVLQGLGSAAPNTTWPRGRTYWDIATFRAPYTTGYYQDGSLLGLGAPPASLSQGIDATAPPHLKRFILSGEPMPTLAKNAALPFNQIPRAVYGVAAVAGLALAYVSHKRFKKAKGNHTP